MAEALQLEERLTTLGGVEAEEQLTRTVMSRIAALSDQRYANFVYRDWLSICFVMAGVALLAAVYCCTTSWADVSGNLLALSMGWSWSALATKLMAVQLEVLLPALAGAALIGLGLTQGPKRAVYLET